MSIPKQPHSILSFSYTLTSCYLTIFYISKSLAYDLVIACSIILNGHLVTLNCDLVNFELRVSNFELRVNRFEF